jgi:hypothetical protein
MMLVKVAMVLRELGTLSGAMDGMTAEKDGSLTVKGTDDVKGQEDCGRSLYGKVRQVGGDGRVAHSRWQKP